MRVPPNITVICLGKSTYARLGIIVNTTPAEASWEGHLTLEFSNSSGADCRIYADEGICQLLFFEGDPRETTYSDRQGKYQHQPSASPRQGVILRQSRGQTRPVKTALSYQAANSGAHFTMCGHIRSHSWRISNWASSLARKSMKCRKARKLKLTTKCWR